MSVALSILLIAFCVQGLVKFAAGFVVPYPTRIGRIVSYYQRGGRIISIYETVTLIIIAALIVDRSPESSAPPRQIMSYAIQADPGLAWREIVLMTVLFCGLYALIAHLVG